MKENYMSKNVKIQIKFSYTKVFLTERSQNIGYMARPHSSGLASESAAGQVLTCRSASRLRLVHYRNVNVANRNN